MVTKVQYETEIAARENAVALLREAEDRVAVLEIELQSKTEDLDELRKRFTWAKASADRHQKRAAATNLRNEKLVQDQRKLGWRVQKLEQERASDVWNARKLELAEERLSLIRDISTITSADATAVYREVKGK